jgi:cytochrome c oxidase assembly protein subunit 15
MGVNDNVGVITAEAPAGAAAPPPGASRGAALARRLLRPLCMATLVGNAVIVVTGAAVRLTGSGLGCPTWPRCTDDSYTNTPALGIHGYIEFGNRTLTGVLGLLVLAALAATIALAPRRIPLIALALAQLLGVATQAVLGGITVRTGLNPWTVAGHFLVSAALIYGAYALWHRAGEGDARPRYGVPIPLVWLARAIAVAAAAVLAAGTVVTGSGPPSGDEAAARTGFDPQLVSQLHADGVFLLLGLTIAGVLAFAAAARTGAPAGLALRNAAAVLLAVELSQSVIGFVQYFLHVPALAAGLHVVGAVLVWIAAVRLVFLARTRAA